MPETDSYTPVESGVVTITPARKAGATLVILFTLYTSLLMACPWPLVEPKLQRFLQPALPLLQDLGLAHRLRLFAPVPPQWNGKVRFRVTHADGSRTDWRFPRSRFGPGDRQDSYNRYLFLYLVWDFPFKSQSLVPAFARYVARETASAQPVRVEIFQTAVRTPSPRFGIGHTMPEAKMEFPMLRYEVATDSYLVTGTPIIW